MAWFIACLTFQLGMGCEELVAIVKYGYGTLVRLSILVER